MKPVIDSVIQYISPSKAQLVDFVDRCCYRYTPLLLVVFVFITGTIDTFGRPMNCMVPSEFTEAWSNYVHQFCYVTGTYLKLYPNGEEQKVYVDYYQWVPFVLIIQAVAMRLPQFFWRSGQSMADIDFPHMHDLCVNIRNSEADKRFENVQKAASYLFQVSKHRGFKTGVGSKATSLYMLSKAMNVIMLLGQIFFLNIFVGKHDLLWGITLARQVWSHKDLSKHVFRYFPRVSYCEFGRDFLGSDPGQMVQEARCTLGINMLNEKVFLVLYFWFYALLLLTVVDLLFRLCRFLGPCSDSYVNDNYLTLVNQNLFFGEHVILVSQDAREVVHFNKHVLGKDGVLLFHFLQQNFGRLIAAEICSTLYHMSQRNRQME